MEYSIEALNQLRNSLDATNVLSESYKKDIMGWALNAVSAAHKKGREFEREQQLQEED